MLTNRQEMIVRELLIYGDNEKSIRFTKSFKRLVQNKYSLQAGLAATTKSQIYTIKKAIISVEQ